MSMTIDTIDLHFQDQPGLIAAYVLRSDGECALIETGPGSCHAALIEGLHRLGLKPVDIRKVFVTHIHLDHSGAAGWWAQQGAQVFVHVKGAPHLINPAKLIESASRIYGDRMQTLWGDILPAPAERVTVLGDGNRVRVGEIEIEAWDTPGHARHHLAFAVSDICFTGDVAGMVVPGCDYLSVTAAPPQFELQPYLESIARLRAAAFRRLYLTHFGPIDDHATHLDRYAARVGEVQHQVAVWIAEGLSGAALAERYTGSERAVSGLSDADWQRYERGNNTVMCAAGIELSVQKSTK
jgi:glyoxylase-like metal-dependent hydrolase (beta-lactamase superfamily II)